MLFCSGRRCSCLLFNMLYLWQKSRFTGSGVTPTGHGHRSLIPWSMVFLIVASLSIMNCSPSALSWQGCTLNLVHDRRADAVLMRSVINAGTNETTAATAIKPLTSQTSLIANSTGILTAVVAVSHDVMACATA